MRSIDDAARELEDLANVIGRTRDADAIRAVLRELSVSRRLGRPTIVCLCGSGRFLNAFNRAEFAETLAGKIVLTIGCNTHDVSRSDELAGQKPMLDELHLRKIDLADEILVINVGGYIGESTANEVRYAHAQGKPVRLLEPAIDPRSMERLNPR